MSDAKQNAVPANDDHRVQSLQLGLRADVKFSSSQVDELTADEQEELWSRSLAYFRLMNAAS